MPGREGDAAVPGGPLLSSSGVTNLPASVHQRLLNVARGTNRPFNEVLQFFAIERFIYRLSMTPHANRFVLKGALMVRVWRGSASRPTRDIDLLGLGDNSLEGLAAVVRDACEIQVGNDGMTFDAESVTAARITEDADYEGVRLRFRGYLGNAGVSVQVDVGFGDALSPGARRVRYPGLLDFPSAELDGYLPEETIAEKLQAMAKLGEINSRMKDFYDIWFLSRTFGFNGDVLSCAISATFRRRATLIAAALPLFESSFASDAARSRQWSAFVTRTGLSDAPGSFEDLMLAVAEFLHPVVSAAEKGRTIQGDWRPSGPWG